MTCSFNELAADQRSLNIIKGVLIVSSQLTSTSSACAMHPLAAKANERTQRHALRPSIRLVCACFALIILERTGALSGEYVAPAPGDGLSLSSRRRSQSADVIGSIMRADRRLRLVRADGRGYEHQLEHLSASSCGGASTAVGFRCVTIARPPFSAHRSSPLRVNVFPSWPSLFRLMKNWHYSCAHHVCSGMLVLPHPTHDCGADRLGLRGKLRGGEYRGGACADTRYGSSRPFGSRIHLFHLGSTSHAGEARADENDIAQAARAMLSPTLLSRHARYRRG